MGLWGIAVHEANFFAGNLRTRDGENVWTASEKALGQIAMNTAGKFLEDSMVLSRLNQVWGRNTIKLSMAKYFTSEMRYGGKHTVFKIIVSQALFQDQNSEKNYLIIGLPEGFTVELFEDIRGSLLLHEYLLRKWSLKNNRLSVLMLIIYIGLKRLLKRTASILQPKPVFENEATPSLLLIQEDNLSMTRSYRGQPHWLFKDSPYPEFRTIVIESNSNLFKVPNRKALKKFRVYGVSKESMYSYSNNHIVVKNIKKAIRTLLYQSIFGPRTFIEIIFQMAMLFNKALILESLCSALNVKLFMTCENYHLESDAMNLIGPQMNIHTISYQYSNMSEIGPIMMTTADTMGVFSPLFHNRWINNGIKPKSFINIGYPYDSSFSLLAEQAKVLSDELINKGVQFSICYFDESVQDNNDKYGIVNKDDHYKEIVALAKMVILDSSIAVIIKSQFAMNSPDIMFKGDEIIEAAIETGRLVNLLYGEDRNIVFPAEAALASDLAIGHSLGATAGLEAALVGSRCILLNPYDMQGSNVEIFKNADILYNNMDSALSAISGYREGRSGYRNLGDWELIIDLFDPYRDGQSANRMRALLEKKIVV